ncbi:putative transferase CAF17 homolog, mitochondrial [Eriocheir sinensis]|uniref:putative transferase CAF17 homolog, mitochondrial n=1 Tax=Eriocheir sinensis TaxID=95602 RepID=UPI0021C72F49|nr:putative transferase CAF17 homolog, mitochondrial [Eriocheir sinensis]
MFPALRHHGAGLLRLWKVRPLQTAPLTRRLLHAERQQHRGLIKVEGTEAADFLQGLVTNDMGHLEGQAAGMYCLLLNRQGRVLHDTIMYRRGPGTFLLECDAVRASQLERHLRMHRVRRRLAVDDITKDLSVWCVFDPEPDLTQLLPVDPESLYMNPHVEAGTALPLEGNPGDVLVIQDPRMRQLGHRLVVPAATASLRRLMPMVEEEKGEGFRVLRYMLGVGEGSEELPPTKCLPLEANCDYLHGISFHKGCYVGQELTARTFHTGVVRKRLLPLIFSEDASAVSPDATVVNEQGKAVGKVRACLGHYGLGLLRVEECLSAKSLTVEDHKVQTFRPPWWPLQASKTKLNQ